MYVSVHRRRVRAWTSRKPGCYNPNVIALALSIFLSGFALFLLGFSIFMYRENRKFGDNQFTVKLLPPPPRLASFAAGKQADWSVGSASATAREEIPLRAERAIREEHLLPEERTLREERPASAISRSA
jgi:hypothetical protein